MPEELRKDRPRHLALFIKSMGGGGAERVYATLARAFVERGHRVDLLVALARGPMLDQLPDPVRVVDLGGHPARRGLPTLLRIPGELRRLVWPALARGRPRVLGSLPALVRYLRSERPDAMLSAMSYDHFVALWANRIAGVATRQVVAVHNTMSQEVGHSPNRDFRLLPGLMRRWYPAADAVVCVSEGSADDLARLTSMPRESLTTIYNPVEVDRVTTLAAEPVEHPWFRPDQPPVLVTMGRLTPQKNQAMLLRAFARVRDEREARLWIMGEGRLRNALAAQARELGIAEDVELSGFVANPFKYMTRARAFVLSSLWEGLPMVLLEALACGTPVVSTDCPSGPAEILGGGAYGRLVPVGDDAALARAMLATLEEAPDPHDGLRSRKPASSSVALMSPAPIRSAVDSKRAEWGP
jgi:glycosyltransferase involved in cell wall biosynthesis